MHPLLVPLLAAPILTHAPATEVEADAPYREVTDVVMVPDLDNDSTQYLISTTADEGSDELWELLVLNPSDAGAAASLEIDGAFQFGVSTQLSPFEITTEDASGNVATIDASNYQTNTEYLAFLASTADQRDFVTELAEEYKAFGTMQGIVPTLIVPETGDDSDSGDSDDGFAAGVLPPTSKPATSAQDGKTNREKCIEDMTVVHGAKPEDCEGAIDSYICCMWEAYVDACTRLRNCNEKYWLYVPCHAAAVAANGVDVAACIATLPLGGL